jgi:hypothetical protein
MKRKKKKQDERLGSILNAESTRSSRRQVGAMGTITSMMILFFAGFLISETRGFVVESNRIDFWYNGNDPKRIEWLVRQDRRTDQNWWSKLVCRGSIRQSGPDHKDCGGKKGLFGIHTEKQLGDGRFVQIQDELGTKFNALYVEKKRN